MLSATFLEENMHKDLVYNVSDEQFLEIINTSNSISEIAKKLGFSHKPGARKQKKNQRENFKFRFNC